jgi:mono/diheme cytochrome c family protein
MTRLSILAIAIASLLCGCESPAYYTPPAATVEMARSKHVELATLERGRALFAYRCIQCHTAPAIWYYRAEDWPSIVNSMAHRASLKPAEREAIVAYILAVRGQR